MIFIMYILFSVSILCDLVRKRSKKCGQLLEHFFGNWKTNSTVMETQLQVAIFLRYFLLLPEKQNLQSFWKGIEHITQKEHNN